MGRALLASLDEQQLSSYLQRVELKTLTLKTITDKRALTNIIRKVRSDGFALVDEELELGLRSIAVPVKARHKGTVAAMNIGVHAVRVSTREMLDRFLPILKDNARLLGHYLG
jgi:IclR family pca regulon transcriptional regulator